ncbi:MAG: hypothetical protein RLZZ77_701 [Bacteroidota bacterium]|jgi:hypothetical protein
MKHGDNPKTTPLTTNALHNNPELRRIWELYSHMASSKTSFCYRGPFMDRFTNTILEISESAMMSQQQAPTMTRKVSFLLVECFQNILRHGETVAETQQNLTDDGVFAFQDLGKHFIINSINFIQSEDASNLRELVDAVNALDTKELKALYLQQLNQSEISTKGGAGLGLIELARKSGQNLLYEINPVNEVISIFEQQVTFSQQEEKTAVPNYLKSTHETYKEMADGNVLLTYKGDFSQKSILPLLDIVEHNISDGRQQDALTRKAGHVLIEILQNIAKHGGSDEYGQDGVFQIGQQDGHLFIQAGNPISLSNKVCLEEKLEYLCSLKTEELKELHKAALRATLKFESKTRSGLGLIEVARMSESRIQYGFEPIDSENYFFVIKATV